MTEKSAPIGVCDLCGEDFPPNVSHYTTQRVPRRYCSRLCRNTANSRAGAEIRSKKAKERVRRGEWKNPSPVIREDATPREIEAWREKMSASVSDTRKQEVESGTWQNPALSDEAREKLSRPRKHGDNPVLHAAFEKLRTGASVADLLPEEQEAHRAYRREIDTARSNRLREKRKPNQRLRAARQAAGLSQQALAQAVGVSKSAISNWERFSLVPRSEEVRRRIESLLKKKIWNN